MSEAQNVGAAQDSGSTANLVYILYLVGLAVGITHFVGLVMAYMNRSSAPEWVQTHYTFQIRTFWIGLLGAAIGIALMFILVGFLVLAAVAIWFIIRCVKGMQCVGRREAYPNPRVLDLVDYRPAAEHQPPPTGLDASISLPLPMGAGEAVNSRPRIFRERGRCPRPSISPLAATRCRASAGRRR